MNNFKGVVSGMLVFPEQKIMYGAHLVFLGGKIITIEPDPEITGPYIMPGFIDSHIHIESSMLIPSQFARMAISHGTIAVVTDPHEVANVAGEEGIQFMINDAKRVPLKFFFGLPSCVPASPMEKSGATISKSDVERLIGNKDYYFLAEMMNYPGVINQDEEVCGKIKAAQKAGKPIDGHAPGLTGADLGKYVGAGISTDHECSNIEEAYQKIALGQKIQIREGSAARNFTSLAQLIRTHPQSVMFCTDDCHPDYLVEGHINKIVARAISMGFDLFEVLEIACINPIKHYSLPMGKLQVGDPADFIVVKDLIDFEVASVYIEGVEVYNPNGILFPTQDATTPDYIFRSTVPYNKLGVVANGSQLNIISAIDGELFTKCIVEDIWCEVGEELVSKPQEDILKIVLLDRYSEADPVIAFIKGFGIKKGAIAASIAHDSHHILAIGADDLSIEKALRWIVKNRGGLCFALDNEVEGLKLPYFGLMTNDEGELVKRKYLQLNENVRRAGCTLLSPFMTASFMALTVIPELKINHNGLFDGINFKSISLFQ